MSQKELIAAATAAQANAYSPYSKRRVGAAVLTTSGAIYASGNVENCCYALTICAERGALYHAIAAGETRFVCLAVTSNEADFSVPCGACRQVLWELAGDLEILVVGPRGRVRRLHLKHLYPEPYKKNAKNRLNNHKLKNKCNVKVDK